MSRLGFLMTRLRPEEKLLLEELDHRPNVKVVRILDGEHYFDISQLPQQVDLVFERSISYSRGLYISRIFEAHGFSIRKAGSVRNQYSLRYLFRLLPLPAGSKRAALDWLQRHSIGRLRLCVPLGNLYLVAQKPTGRTQSSL